MQGKKVVATAPAQVVALDSKASDTQAEVSNGTKGERELKALQFAGKKVSLQLGTESAKAQSKDGLHQLSDLPKLNYLHSQGAGNCSLALQFQANDLIIHRVYGELRRRHALLHVPATRPRVLVLR